MPDYSPVGLATAAPSALHRRLVAVLAALLVLATVVLWPQAEDAGAELTGFVGSYETAVAICDLLTAVLLFNQFAQFRTANLLILACGYLFTAIIVSIHLGSFPGVFTATGLFGGDADTAPWLWCIWHAAFPLAVLLSAVMRRPVGGNPHHAIAASVILTGCAGVAGAVFSVRLNNVMPSVIDGMTFTPFFLNAVYPVIVALCLIALAALLFVPTAHPLITLYLALAVLAFSLDAVNNWHSGARYAIGWYLGRANGFVASVLLCVAFVAENAVLLRYANRAASRLAEVNDGLTVASAAKSRFFAAASHDLRQPFQAMLLFFHALEARASDAQRPVVTELGLAMKATEALLTELLDVARLENGSITPQPQEVDLGRLVAAVTAELGPVATEKGLTLRIHQTPSVVHSDPVLLRRILFNLTTNAIRYTRRGGVLIGLRRRDDAVQIEVWDTGIGIAADQATLIFGEFYQVHGVARDRAQSLGLGLAIVKRLSEMLGCNVSLASRVNRGTVFRVAVPVRWAARQDLG